jgi:hypothetical protein
VKPDHGHTWLEHEIFPSGRVRVGNFTSATNKEIDKEPHWGAGLIIELGSE